MNLFFILPVFDVGNQKAAVVVPIDLFRIIDILWLTNKRHVLYTLSQLILGVQMAGLHKYKHVVS